jgi:hypothetical protein
MRISGGREGSGCEPPTSSARRRGAIARRAAILLGGTAAMALSITQPASAISINDQVAAAAGGIGEAADSNGVTFRAETAGPHPPSPRLIDPRRYLRTLGDERCGVQQDWDGFVPAGASCRIFPAPEPRAAAVLHPRLRLAGTRPRTGGG